MITTFEKYQREHEFFVGIDSDGCVFDTMEIKHKECFIPAIIKHWGLQPISKFAREVAEFVNLYSRERGINRWPALTKAFDLLGRRPEVQARHATIPEVPAIKAFIASGRPLGNATLAKLIAEQSDEEGKKELQQALDWSNAVNAAVKEMVENVPPFPYVRQSLERLTRKADIIVVSQTPSEALTREWQEHDIDGWVKMICGQEMGTKSEHLQKSADGRYDKDKMLMIGDAPGDLKAAESVQARFYPINPGKEDQSWKRFFDEAIDRFFNGDYSDEYQQGLIDDFLARLPEQPPWKINI